MLTKILRNGTIRKQATKMRALFSDELVSTDGGYSSKPEISHKESLSQGKAKLATLKDKLYLEYKEYPSHIGHWNPDSPDYLASERDEGSMKRSVDGYNEVIDNIKNSLRLQEDLYNAIEKLDRPYLRGTPGIDRNVYSEVQDYSNPTGHGRIDPLIQESIDLEYSLGNTHRYIRNEPFDPKITPTSNELAWQEELSNRPINPDYHPDKGYKFDVPIPYEDRTPHVADRLGHPYQLGTHLDRLLRLERDITNPSYLDQPFVQAPSVSADADVDFTEGEVLYENEDTIEWGQFWQLGVMTTLAWQGFWVLGHKIFKNTFPVESMYSEVDIRLLESNVNFMDNYGISMVVIPPIIYYSFNYSLQLTQKLVSRFPSKLQYNQSKDLLFMTLPGTLSEPAQEVVVEMDHVEIAPPGLDIGGAFLSVNKADGYFTITDMNKQEQYYIRKDQAFWNPRLRSEFLDRVTNLWDETVYDTDSDATGKVKVTFVEKDKPQGSIE